MMTVNLNYVPKGWEKLKISKKLFFQEGPGVRKWQFTDEGIKLLNVGNINNGKVNLNSTSNHLSIEEATGKYKHFLVDEGDLLIACSGIIVDNFHNKIAFAEKEHLPLCLNTSTMRFKTLKKDVDLDYFKYFLQTVHFSSQLQKLITGSAQLNFGPSHIKKIDFLYPPLETQKRIAQILDDAADLLDKTAQLLIEYDLLAQSIFLEMFGDPVSNPKGWGICLFSDILSKIESGWSPVCENEKRENKSEWAILKLGATSYGFYNQMENKKFSQEIPDAKLNCQVQKDDLLFTRKNTYHMVGATAFVFKTEPNLIIPDTIFKLKYITDMTAPIFLYYLLNHQNYSKEIQRMASGSAASMPNISKAKLMSKSLILPPIDLQNQFSDKITLIEQQKELAKQELKESEDLFNCLLQKAFKGELV